MLRHYHDIVFARFWRRELDIEDPGVIAAVLGDAGGDPAGFADYAAGNGERLRPVQHPLVITHPVTGRKSLYLSSHIGGIVGWPMPEARAFIRDLMEHATQRQFVYAHQWRVNDLVMWDNRTVMHRARRFDDLREVRDLRRTSIKGTGLTVELAPAQAAE